MVGNTSNSPLPAADTELALAPALASNLTVAGMDFTNKEGMRAGEREDAGKAAPSAPLAEEDDVVPSTVASPIVQVSFTPHSHFSLFM